MEIVEFARKKISYDEMARALCRRRGEDAMIRYVQCCSDLVLRQYLTEIDEQISKLTVERTRILVTLQERKLLHPQQREGSSL